MKRIGSFKYLGGLLALSACSQWGVDPSDFLGEGSQRPSQPPAVPTVPTQPPVSDNCGGQSQSFDDVYAFLLNDLLRQDADDRPFTRYLLLNARFNEGVCTEDLDTDRSGLFKGLQMVSVASQIQLPFAIDANETLYRVDIRDYDWDREIVVNGESFDDGWQAMLAQNAFAIEFSGDEADVVKNQAQTTIPWVSAGSFLDAISRGALYYPLIGVDVNATLDDFISFDLQIDVVENLDQAKLIRAGELLDPAANEARIVERHDLEIRQGYLWWEHRGDFESALGDRNGIVDDPFQYPDRGSTVVFSLPNQFMAFIVADLDSNIVAQGVPRFEVGASSPVAPTPLSLAAQHASGFPSIVDEVRSDVEINRFNFSANDFEAVQNMYPRPEEFAQIQASDFENVEAALQQASILPGSQEPVNLAVQTFREDLPFGRLAAELGVTSDNLEPNLALLHPALSNSVNVPTPRATLESHFLESICIMQTFSQNRPAFCF